MRLRVFGKSIARVELRLFIPWEATLADDVGARTYEHFLTSSEPKPNYVWSSDLTRSPAGPGTQRKLPGVVKPHSSFLRV